jgi:hypothetical protein
MYMYLTMYNYFYVLSSLTYFMNPHTKSDNSNGRRVAFACAEIGRRSREL